LYAVSSPLDIFLVFISARSSNLPDGVSAQKENSTAGQPTSDKIAVLPVDGYSQNDNSGDEIGKEKEKQASTEDDGSFFKLLINEAIGGPKDMEKNNDSIYTNHQGAERTDK
jgi:hypothetical protein